MQRRLRPKRLENVRTYISVSLSALFVLTLGLTACGGDPAGPGDDGNLFGDFTLTFSGDVSRIIDGDGGGFWETTDSQTDRSVWVLSLTEGDAQALEGLQVLVGGARPAPGEYILSAADPDSLASGEGVAFAAVNPSLIGAAFLGISVSGTLTITESTAQIVRGTVLMSAQGTVFPPGGGAAPGVALVEGNFEALLTEPPDQAPIEPPTVDPS